MRASLITCALVLCAAACFAQCDLVASSALRASASAALDRHRYSAAAVEFQRALDACPEQRVILLDLSQAHARARNFPEAIRAAQTFLEAEPNAIAGRLALANAYFMAQRFPEACTEYERVLK